MSSTFSHKDWSCDQRRERRYLGDGVLVCEDAEEELRGGLSLAVCDWTVTVHDQVLFDPRRQVLLPAGLRTQTHTNTRIRTTTPH